MLRLKNNCRMAALRPPLVLAILAAERLYSTHGIEECVVTSINDSTHGRGSLHFSGQACDLRTRNVPADILPRLFSDLKAVLATGEYDVVLENDHIHLEWQPKGIGG